MLLWLLPTFLWSGTKLDETDRPFAAFAADSSQLVQSRDDYDDYYEHYLRRKLHLDEFQTGFTEEHEKELLPKTNELSPDKRIGTILNTVTTHTSFSTVYNSLLCPQCQARLALINGVLVCI